MVVRCRGSLTPSRLSIILGGVPEYLKQKEEETKKYEILLNLDKQ